MYSGEAAGAGGAPAAACPPPGAAPVPRLAVPSPPPSGRGADGLAEWAAVAEPACTETLPPDPSMPARTPTGAAGSAGPADPTATVGRAAPVVTAPAGVALVGGPSVAAPS